MMHRSISFLLLLIFFLCCSVPLTLAAMTRNEALRELGLKNSKATEAEIKKAYRKRSLETHPDKGGSNEEFVRVAEAYQVLTGGGGGAGGGGEGGFGGFDFNMSDDEKIRMANEMFFEMFDEFLTDTDAAADKFVDWVWDFFEDAEWEKTQDGKGGTSYQYKGKKEKTEEEKSKPKKDGMFKSIVRWGARKGIKALQGLLEGDNTVMTINGQQMTGADFKKFREQAQQRVQQRKMSSGGNGEQKTPKASKDRSGEF